MVQNVGDTNNDATLYLDIIEVNPKVLLIGGYSFPLTNTIGKSLAVIMLSEILNAVLEMYAGKVDSTVARCSMHITLVHLTL